MKVTFLMDNEAKSSRFLTEHGFSCWIETETPQGEKLNILFDTGQTDKFLTNAARLSIDIKSNHHTIISHGHYDHGGGLKALLSEAPHTGVTLSQDAFNVFVKGDVGESFYYAEKSIGLRESLLKEYPSSFNLIGQETVLEEGITLYTDLPHTYPLPQNDRLCKVGERKKMVKDDFSHEIYLFIEEGDQLFCFTGCAHRGVVNIMALAEEKFPEKKNLTLLGGFHLSRETENGQIEALDRFIRESSKNWQLVTGHCTGMEAFEKMKETLPCQVEYGYAGLSLEYPKKNPSEEF